MPLPVNPRGGVFVSGAGWSSPVARQAHNLKVAGSNPAPATKNGPAFAGLFLVLGGVRIEPCSAEVVRRTVTSY